MQRQMYCCDWQCKYSAESIVPGREASVLAYSSTTGLLVENGVQK